MISSHDVGNGRSGHAAQMPHLQNRIEMALFFGQQHGTAVVQQQHHRFLQPGDFVDQSALDSPQSQVGFAGRLARFELLFAQTQHHDFGLTGRSDGLGEPRTVVALIAAAVCDEKPRRGVFCCKSYVDGGHGLLTSARMPCAQLVAPIPGHGADERNAAGGFGTQGQQCILVLQQHDIHLLFRS